MYLAAFSPVPFKHSLSRVNNLYLVFSLSKQENFTRATVRNPPGAPRGLVLRRKTLFSAKSGPVRPPQGLRGLICIFPSFELPSLHFTETEVQFKPWEYLAEALTGPDFNQKSETVGPSRLKFTWIGKFIIARTNEYLTVLEEWERVENREEGEMEMERFSFSWKYICQLSTT